MQQAEHVCVHAILNSAEWISISSTYIFLVCATSVLLYLKVMRATDAPSHREIRQGVPLLRFSFLHVCTLTRCKL